MKSQNAGRFAGFLKEFGSSENYEDKACKDYISKQLEGTVQAQMFI